MLEEIVKWMFAALVQAVFFKLGSFFLWVISFGRLKPSLTEATPITVFGVSIFGFSLTLALIFIASNMIG